MVAAVYASDETVAFLLSKGADPDLLNVNGQTALVAAIHSKCSSTIALLAPVTRKGMEAILANLATHHYQTELTPAIEVFLRSAALDQDNAIKGVMHGTWRGAASMLKILTNDWNRNTLHPSDANDVLKIALKSDNAETVQVVMALVREVSLENISLALTRGRADVVKLLGLGEDERSIEAT